MPSSPLICLYCFFFQCSLTHRHLHSFPTRRSSDLVTGMTARPEFSAVSFNLIPTVGEYFVFPALTTTGACEIMVFEGVPGGPMDCWNDVKLPLSILRAASTSWKLFFRGRRNAAAISNSPMKTAS